MICKFEENHVFRIRNPIYLCTEYGLRMEIGIAFSNVFCTAHYNTNSGIPEPILLFH